MGELSAFCQEYRDLFGDKRLYEGFRATLSRVPEARPARAASALTRLTAGRT